MLGLLNHFSLQDAAHGWPEHHQFNLQVALNGSIAVDDDFIGDIERPSLQRNADTFIWDNLRRAAESE